MAVSKSTALRFTRVKLVNWRNFQAAEMNLGLRCFIVGPNASGKSNVLDSIRFLSEIARPGSGGLQAAVEGRGGLSAIRCLQARTISHVEIEVAIGTEEQTEVWAYRIRINSDKKTRTATVLEEEIKHHGRIIERRHKTGADDRLIFSQTSLEQVQMSKDFRELADFLSSCRYLHVVPQIVRDRQRARLEGEDPFGGDLLRRMKEMPPRTRDSRLRKISEALTLAVPQFGGIELKDDMDGVPHLFAEYRHWRPHASKQPETAFSDGTLRLIGLLWSIAERGGPLLLEEPELSLNDAVVSELPKMFSKMQRVSARQVMITTHSSSLLNDANIGLKEVHRIVVSDRGSTIETIHDNKAVSAQVNGGMTISEAVFPLLVPNGIERLGTLAIAN